MIAERREFTTRHVEYLLPSGCAGGEVSKAYAVALADYRRLHGLPDDAPTYDDWLRFDARDDQIVISFDVDTEPTSQNGAAT